MNYAAARQRQSNGRWDWTVRNDDRIWRVAPCDDHEDGHATREEAERHHWEYEMARPIRVFQDPDEQRKCEVCSAWTHDRVKQEGDWHQIVLCSEHQTREAIEQLRPFSPGQTVIYS